MTRTKTLTVYLENRNEDIDIDVEVEFEVLNNGIGAYEYWGHKCYDKGSDYLEVIGVEWDKTGFSPEEISVIDKAIEDSYDEWESETVIECDDDDDAPEVEHED